MNSSATSACSIDGDDKADDSERPLQPILHSKLRQPVAGMENERDDGGADPVEHGRHRREGRRDGRRAHPERRR